MNEAVSRGDGPAALAFLRRRRSHPARSLRAPAPDRAALSAILEAGLRVPDHGKLEPWRLVVLEAPALARMAAAATAHAEAAGIEPERAEKGIAQFRDGVLAVVVVASPRETDRIPEVEQVLSAGAVCLSLLNAALAAGWGACWLTGWPAHDRAFAAPAFALQPAEFVAGIVHIGTPGPTPPERPRPDPARVVTFATGPAQ